MDKSAIELAKANNRMLKAMLSLQIYNYEKQADRTDEKIELLLANGGLGYQEIADLLGKKPDAVRMLLKRNKT